MTKRPLTFCLVCWAANSCGAPAAPAAIVKDFYTDTSLWNGVSGQVSNFYDPGALVSGVASAFTGNGGRLEKVGFVFSFNYASGAPNNTPEPGDFTLRFSFYQSTTDFISHPLSSVITHEFALPTNPTWRTRVGESGVDDLYYFEVDVGLLNIITTPGQTQLVSLVPLDATGIPGIVSYAQFAQPGGIGAGPDWYYFNTSDRNYGPATLTSLGAPYANVASRITTVQSLCPTDLDGDGVVNSADLALLLGAWGGIGPSDFDNNATTNSTDLALLLGSWGPCPAPPACAAE